MHQGSQTAGQWEGPRHPCLPGRGSSLAPLWSRWCSRPPARSWGWRKRTGAGWSSASCARTPSARVASLCPGPWKRSHQRVNEKQEDEPRETEFAEWRWKDKLILQTADATGAAFRINIDMISASQQVLKGCRDVDKLARVYLLLLFCCFSFYISSL